MLINVKSFICKFHFWVWFFSGFFLVGIFFVVVVVVFINNILQAHKKLNVSLS